MPIDVPAQKCLYVVSTCLFLYGVFYVWCFCWLFFPLRRPSVTVTKPDFQRQSGKSAILKRFDKEDRTGNESLPKWSFPARPPSKLEADIFQSDNSHRDCSQNETFVRDLLQNWTLTFSKVTAVTEIVFKTKLSCEISFKTGSWHVTSLAVSSFSYPVL